MDLLIIVGVVVVCLLAIWLARVLSGNSLWFTAIVSGLAYLTCFGFTYFMVGNGLVGLLALLVVNILMLVVDLIRKLLKGGI